MKQILILILSLSFLAVKAQFKLVETKTVESDFFRVDNLRNVYAIKGSMVTKFWENSTSKNTFSSKMLGNIQQMDVANPLQIILFYPDNSQLILLDNTLSEIKRIALEKHNMEQASLVCSSTNNSFWLYDQATSQLVRFDRTMKKLQETGSLNQLLYKELNPDFLVEVNNHLYLNDPSYGLYVFDIYGAYVKSIPIKEMKSIFINEDNVYYTKNNQAYVFSIKSAQDLKLPLKFVVGNKMQFRKKYFYLSSGEKIYKYEEKKGENVKKQ